MNPGAGCLRGKRYTKAKGSDGHTDEGARFHRLKQENFSSRRDHEREEDAIAEGEKRQADREGLRDSFRVSEGKEFKCKG